MKVRLQKHWLTPSVCRCEQERVPSPGVREGAWGLCRAGTRCPGPLGALEDVRLERREDPGGPLREGPGHWLLGSPQSPGLGVGPTLRQRDDWAGGCVRSPLAPARHPPGPGTAVSWPSRGSGPVCALSGSVLRWPCSVVSHWGELGPVAVPLEARVCTHSTSATSAVSLVQQQGRCRQPGGRSPSVLPRLRPTTRVSQGACFQGVRRAGRRAEIAGRQPSGPFSAAAFLGQLVPCSWTRDSGSVCRGNLLDSKSNRLS